MAFARSASGPGGLSINPNSANSLFGSNNTTPAAGGMFGSTQASKPLFGAAPTTTAPSVGLFGSAQSAASQPGGLFGSTTTTSQPQTGGLFGATAATTQPQTGGLFGSTATSQPQTGGLFGSTTTQPQTGGLFGQPAATTQPQTGGLFGATQQTGGGLFGNTSTMQPAATGGLFGAPAATSQPQQTGGLFGQTNQNQTQNTNSLLGGNSTPQNQGGGLFGGLNQNQNKPTNSFFGNNQQSQQSNMFSQPQQPQQPQQAVPGTLVEMGNVKDTTRFQDMHENLRNLLEKMDDMVSKQITLKNQCEAMMPQHGMQITSVPTDVQFCDRKRQGVEDVIGSDAQAVSGLRDLIKKDAEHAKLSFRAIDNLKLPPQYHTSGHWPLKGPSGNPSAGAGEKDIVGYIAETSDELAGQLAKYQRNVTDIELHLRRVEASTSQQIHSYIARRNGSSGAQNDELQELVESLQDFERGILNVAGKVGGAREGVQSLEIGNFMGQAPNGSSTTRRNGPIY